MSLSKPSYEELERRLDEVERALAAARAAAVPAGSEPAVARHRHEARFSAILRAAMDGFWIVDRKGRFVEVNDAYCDLVGYSRDELMGMSIGDVEAAEAPEEIAAHIEKVMRQGRDRFLTHHRRKDGAILDVEVSAHYLAEGEGCFFVFLRDVTLRLRMEEALRASRDGLEHEARERAIENALMRTAIEQLPVAVMMTDLRGGIEYVNPAFTTITGYAREEVLGRNPRILKSGVHDHAFYLGMWETILSGAAWRGEVVNRRKDGVLYTQELAIAPVRDGDGRPSHFVGIGHDVTEAKRLRESLEMTQLAVDHSSDMFLWVSPQGRFTFANESALRNLGYTRDELYARSLWDISGTVRPEGWRATWEETRQAGFFRLEDEVRRSDGSTFPGEVLVTHVRLGATEIQCAIVRDVTERKRSEEALRESTRVLLESQRVARIGSYRFDIASGTWASTAVLDELFGICDPAFRRDVPGWLSLVHPAQREEMAAYLTDEVLGRRQRFDREYRIVRPNDGEERWVHGLGDLVADSEGRLTEMIGTIQDITERKRAEAALRDTEERLRGIVETAVNGIITIGGEGLIESFNPAAERLFGYRAEEILGRNVSVLMPSPHREQHDGYLRRYLESGQRSLSKSRELVGRRKDGTEFPFQLSLAELGIGRKRVFAGIIRDLTAEQEGQRALAASEARHRALLKGLPDFIFVLDREGRFRDYYAPDPSILFVPPESFLGRRVSEVLPEEVARQLEAAFEVARRTDETQSVEYALAVGSETRAFEARVVSTDMGTVTVVSRDVTHRKALEAQLLQAQKMEAVGQLAGGVAHDFNNLITVILSCTGFAKELLSPAHPAHDDLDEVLRAGRRAADLVRQLLAFSRRQIIQPRVLSINDLVLNMGKLLRRVLGEDIELATWVSADLWLTRIDPGQLEQVLVNLAVNARDAMPQGGKLTIETGNVVFDEGYVAGHAEAQAGEHVMLAVSDNGVGMTPEVLARIFDPFFTTKETGRGTGLGLSTCYGIVKQAGGHIGVYSEPGRGTAFKIYLPRAVERQRETVPGPPEAQEVYTGSETILLAEDDASVRASVVRTLMTLGYTVLESATPREALRMAETGERIDLLITDVVMPGLNGRELAQRVTSLHPEAKVLYMSGYTANAIVHGGEIDPAVAFLEKPFLPETLARKVRETLDQGSG